MNEVAEEGTFLLPVFWEGPGIYIHLENAANVLYVHSIPTINQ